MIEKHDMNMTELAEACHQQSVEAGWYCDPKTGKQIERNKAEMLALIHSEISEALEFVRKGGMDKHLPNRKGEEVELADAVIRIFDYAGYCNFDIESAVIEKLEYNKTRADHKLENRNKAGGKSI